jgi:hypothetical protein
MRTTKPSSVPILAHESPCSSKPK